MKCPQCGNDNEEGALFCGRCGAALSVSAEAHTLASDSQKASADEPSRRWWAIKVWLIGGLTGLATGLSWTLVMNAFSTDGVFDGGEFGVSLVTPALAGIVVALATRSGIKTTLAVAYLTLLIPILGANFGASGSEPLWLFGALGLVGGLVWSTPFVIMRQGKPRILVIAMKIAMALVALFVVVIVSMWAMMFMARDGDQAVDLDDSQAVGLYGDSQPTIFLDDFTEMIKVTPFVLEGEISRGATSQDWTFQSDRGQVLRFEPRPKPESHIDFEHVEMILFTNSGVIAADEQLGEIELPETGTYTLHVEGDPDQSSGAYAITISSD